MVLHSRLTCTYGVTSYHVIKTSDAGPSAVGFKEGLGGGWG